MNLTGHGTAASDSGAVGKATVDLQRATSTDPAIAVREVRARWILLGAMFVWVASFLVTRAIALAHGGAALPWDSSWYAEVAQHGYHFDGDITHQQTVAFLPAYPFALRLFISAGLSPPSAALVLCILCSGIGLMLLQRGLSACMDPLWSATACALFVASPFSLYFLNGYSESLYFLFFGGYWWALLRRRDDALAALLAGFACAVRPFGLVLAFVWVIHVLRKERAAGRTWSQALTRIIAFGPLAISGLLAVCLYYYARFDDLFLYRNAMLAWSSDLVNGAGSEIVDHLRIDWRALAELHPGLVIDSAPQAARMLLLAFVVLLPLAARRIPLEFSLYGIGLLLFCLLTTEGAVNLGRHLATNLALPLCGLAVFLTPFSAGTLPSFARFWQWGAIGIAFVLALVVQMHFVALYFHSAWVS